jgi:hypothetical protein
MYLKYRADLLGSPWDKNASQEERRQEGKLLDELRNLLVRITRYALTSVAGSEWTFRGA